MACPASMRSARTTTVGRSCGARLTLRDFRPLACAPSSLNTSSWETACRFDLLAVLDQDGPVALATVVVDER